uniref:Reverse transcriptase domain-containing protein n=1 Tax=Fagus sylvatica TaxID=28930 RepID=A0A2N9G9R7_FAGSY
MEPQSSRTNEDLMEEFEEELELLVDKANRLICKNGRFSLKASSTKGEKANRPTLVGKVIAEKVLNKNKAQNLPLEYISKENAEAIGNGIGKFIEANLAGVVDARWGNFIRVKVKEGRKDFGRWMVADSIINKANRVSDLFFSDVIDAHLMEGRKSNGDEDEKEHVIHEREERVETLVSNTEVEILLQRVISVAEYDEEVGLDGTFSFVNSNLKGSRLGESKRKSDMGASSNGTIKDLVLSEPNQEVTPQLVVRLGPCGPVQNQLTPMGFSLTQARFLAWASVMHSKDMTKPNTKPHNVIVRDLEESSCAEKSRTSKRESIPFWDHLNKIAAAFLSPWLCCGDFNCIVSQAEKKGGRSFVESSKGELRNFLDNCNLIDLGFKGNSFTWTNKRMGRDNIKERLDRAVANVEWKRLFPKATIKHLPMLSSNHAPLVINSHEDIPNGPKPFRFEEAWTRDSNCSMVIKKSWVDRLRSPPQQSLFIRIRNVKVQLKWWNKFVFGSIQSRVTKVKDELERVQALDATLENGIKEEKLQKEYDECLRREELLWRQKSRVTWLTTSGLNTKFFHITTLVRRRRNQICFLKNNSGSWVQGNEAIGTSFSSFFSELFKSSNPSIPMEVKNLFSNVISFEENEEICNIPTEVEIKNVVFSMGSLKAPGPDGLPPLFYKHYWEILKKEVIEAVQNFFYTRTLSEVISPLVEASAKVTLSPLFLFILGSEVLSQLLHNAENIGSFKGFPLAPTCPKVSHLLFADDLIIFAKATVKDARAI